MGYGSYQISGGPHHGELGGYGIEAVCDAQGCSTKIDRGLAYLCGRSPGSDEFGCGGYFCEDHLTFGARSRMCRPCADAEQNDCADEDHPPEPGTNRCACGEALYGAPRVGS